MTKSNLLQNAKFDQKSNLIRPQAHSYLQNIANYVPGKSKTESQSKVIKLSSNENALGASPKAIEAYKNHVGDLFRYYDGSCTLLREALAKKFDLNPQGIVCGAGSDEIISLLTSAFSGVGDEIIYSEHGFLMYPISAQRVGALPVAVAEQNLKADVAAIIAAITSKTKIIFLANPNNPTGSYVNAAEINHLIEKTPKEVLIVLDCAYEEFVEASNYPNALDLVRRHSNVVATRTFSKIYGLASLRIGWCFAATEIAEILNKIRGPFNVSGPAQIAALEALLDDNFLTKSKAHNSKWLGLWQQEFDQQSSFQKFHLFPSVGNFVLLDFGSAEKCLQINKHLLSCGIILREMSAYGLPSALRASIGTDSENEQLFAALKTFSKS